jgi:hypothetical protein
LEAFREFFSNAFDKKTLLDDYVINNGFKPKDRNVNPLFM